VPQVPADQPATQQQQNQQPVAAAQEPEEMTFGYPNSLLRQNDIEPSMLYHVPEELRVEILSTIQVQYEEWQRAQMSAAVEMSLGNAG